MFSINELTQEITITRGDDACFALIINSGSNLAPDTYKPTVDDKFYMAIERPNECFEKAVVKKVIDTTRNLMTKDGNFIVDLVADDTLCLEPGLYYYEIKASLYRQNRFRKAYLVYTLESDGTFTLFNEEDGTFDDAGTYTLVDTTIYFNSSSGDVLVGTLLEGVLTIDDIEYRQENNAVNTIIPKTRFIVEG